MRQHSKTWVAMATVFGLALLPVRAESPYFDTPSDSPLDPAAIPPKFEKGLVARVGKGGVTAEDFDRAQTAYASGMGIAQSHGGYSRKAMALNDRQKANALHNAIDEELLFQAALESGADQGDLWKSRVRAEYLEHLSALPQPPPEDPKAPIAFTSIHPPDVEELTEERILAYFTDHPQEFMAPARLKIKYNSYPINDDEGLGRKSFARARAHPETYDEWQGEEWVVEGHTPSFIQEGMTPETLNALYSTPKGSVSPVIHGMAEMYLFWVLDREESTGVLPLEKVRIRVLRRMALARLTALRAIADSDPERFYLMALNAGFHRYRLKQDLGFRYWSIPKLDRSKVLEELRSKSKIEILVPELAQAGDKRKESQRDFMSAEEKEMEAFLKSQQHLRNTPPPTPSLPPPSSPMGWKDWLGWLVWPVVILGGFIAARRFMNS